MEYGMIWYMVPSYRRIILALAAGDFFTSCSWGKLKLSKPLRSSMPSPSPALRESHRSEQQKKAGRVHSVRAGLVSPETTSSPLVLSNRRSLRWALNQLNDGIEYPAACMSVIRNDGFIVMASLYRCHRECADRCNVP